MEIVTIEDLKRKKKALDYAKRKGLDPANYNNFVKAMEGLMFIDELMRKYECKIEALCGNKKADCKSLLELMGLGAKYGSQILFRFDGADEEEAAAGLGQLLR